MATPGLEGERFVRGLFGDNVEQCPSIIDLPNIVDDRRFMIPTDVTEVRGRLRKHLNVGSDVKIAIWPARHITEKGIPEFLSNLRPSNLNDWKILIIGDGPERGNVARAVRGRGLEDNVILHDFVDPAAMPELYQGSDLFVLPSIRDANPLSAVEALMCGLPILVSNRIGNFPEALQQNVNGWGFDPFDTLQMKVAVESAFGASPVILRSMGLESRRIALEIWESESVVARFFDQILDRKGKI